MGLVAAGHNSHHYASRNALVIVVTLIYTTAVVSAALGLNVFFRAEFRRYQQAALILPAPV